MKNSKEISALIFYLADKKGLTITELAKRVGVAKSSLSRYKNGERDFPVNDIGKYADVLNVSIEYLLGLGKYADSNILEKVESSQYHYLPTAISAGLPIEVDGITETQKISIPDSLMGKWAGQRDIFITRIFGESMNRIMPDQSLIAIKPTSLENLKDGDVVVYSLDHDYSVKKLLKQPDRLVFRPDSTDDCFIDSIVSRDSDKLKIHGKVVLYIVEMD